MSGFKIQRTLLITVLLFCGVNSKAQEQPAGNVNRIAIKSYFNTALALEIGDFSAGRMSFALSKSSGKRGNFQELEISSIDFSSEQKYYSQNTGDPFNYKINTSSVQLRYEYAFCFGGADHKIVPYLGIFLSPHFARVKYKPLLSPPFPAVTHNTGVKSGIIPRVQWNIREKWFLDLNLPFTLIQAEQSAIIVRNPSYTLKQQKSSQFDLNGVMNVSVRLGIGVRL